MKWTTLKFTCDLTCWNIDFTFSEIMKLAQFEWLEIMMLKYRPKTRFRVVLQSQNSFSGGSRVDISMVFMKEIMMKLMYSPVILCKVDEVKLTFGWISEYRDEIQRQMYKLNSNNCGWNRKPQCNIIHSKQFKGEAQAIYWRLTNRLLYPVVCDWSR